MFDKQKVTITETSDARKKKIADNDAWNLLQNADELIIGRGKKFTVFNPANDDREIILKQALGRTGNLRAPALKIGSRLIIGYSDEMYSTYIG